MSLSLNFTANASAEDKVVAKPRPAGDVYGLLSRSRTPSAAPRPAMPRFPLSRMTRQATPSVAPAADIPVPTARTYAPTQFSGRPGGIVLPRRDMVRPSTAAKQQMDALVDAFGSADDTPRTTSPGLAAVAASQQPGQDDSPVVAPAKPVATTDITSEPVGETVFVESGDVAIEPAALAVVDEPLKAVQESASTSPKVTADTGEAKPLLCPIEEPCCVSAGDTTAASSGDLAALYGVVPTPSIPPVHCQSEVADSGEQVHVPLVEVTDEPTSPGDAYCEVTPLETEEPPAPATFDETEVAEPQAEPTPPVETTVPDDVPAADLPPAEASPVASQSDDFAEMLGVSPSVAGEAVEANEEIDSCDSAGSAVSPALPFEFDGECETQIEDVAPIQQTDHGAATPTQDDLFALAVELQGEAPTMAQSVAAEELDPPTTDSGSKSNRRQPPLLKSIRETSVDLTPQQLKIGDEMSEITPPQDLAASQFGIYQAAAISGNEFVRYPVMHYTWASPKMRHKPLYFEQPNLERYGTHAGGTCLASAAATARFVGATLALPYQIGVNSPSECIYTLGVYRPGACTPHYFHVSPLNPKGLLYQGAAVTGLVFLFP